MDKKKTIIIAIIVTVILVLLFGGITLSNATKKPVNNKNTENVNETEDSNTVAGNVSDSQKEEATHNSENANDEGGESFTEETEDAKNDNSEEVATPDSNEPTNQPSQEEEPSSESSSTDAKPKYTYTDLNKTMYATSSVNVRDLPSTDGSKAGSLSKGQEVKVTGQCNETKWYRISLNGSTVYVSNNYLTDTKPQSTPATPSQPSTPDTPSASEHIAEKVYTNASIGDGLDQYRNGLHMYTADGKYKLYVHTEWNGMKGYFFLSGEDSDAFGIAYINSSYREGYEFGHSLYYETGIYEKINGKYYEYQFYAMYTYDDNGNKVY